MVFLTLSCWIRNRGPDRYWKVQEVLKHARVRARLFPGGEGAKRSMLSTLWDVQHVCSLC